MRLYEVQPGDSPGSIAAAHAGCPKCSRDLIAANPHKPIRRFPNGYVTFQELRAGEKLRLPDKWWSKEFDELPPSYFAALPNPDGVTGVGATYTELGPLDPVVLAPDTADAPLPATLTITAQGAATAIAADPNYCASVARVGSAVNTAVHTFKSTWNATQSPLVPINTGNFEAPTSDALRFVLGTSPAACPTRAYVPPTPTTPPPVLVASNQRPGLSTGAIFGIALVGASAIGTVIYLATRR